MSADQEGWDETSSFELWQNGMMVAGTDGPVEAAWRDMLHYAAMYQQDGPVEVYRVTRQLVGRFQQEREG